MPTQYSKMLLQVWLERELLQGLDFHEIQVF